MIVASSASTLAIDARGNRHITYLDVTNLDLKYAVNSSGTWSVETVDGSANMVGSYDALALDNQGNPHVSYYDQSAGQLKYARKVGGVWVRECGERGAGDAPRMSIGDSKHGGPPLLACATGASMIADRFEKGSRWRACLRVRR